jgi:hypothetical protein
MMAYTSADIQAKVRWAAQQQGVDPALALAMANQESSFNPDAVSRKGAIGVMQLMPATAAQMRVDPSDVDQNIWGGVSYIKWLQTNYTGQDTTKTLWAYNAGPGAMQRGLMPKETENYISQITGDLGNWSAEGPISPLTSVSVDGGGTAETYDVAGLSILASVLPVLLLALAGAAVWYMMESRQDPEAD